MPRVFVDSAHYVAVLSVDDSLHARALAISAELSVVPEVQFVTTDAVLVEVLAYYSRFGAQTRVRTADMVSKVLEDPRVTVVLKHPRCSTTGSSCTGGGRTRPTACVIACRWWCVRNKRSATC